jgi:glycosyltransferase involved in cell wall biosynthesis
MTKIAVYTIALNEEKHVKRWYESAKDADLLLIADTGSTDKTRFIAKSLGIEVYEISVDPWRFDVARNAALALIPKEIDFCISMDVDEVLVENWRELLEEDIKNGFNFPGVRLVTSRDANGNPLSYFDAPRIHPRQGCYWKYPIHEIISPKIGLETIYGPSRIHMNHIPDPMKSRSSYMHLLQDAVREFPQDWRMHHYLVREYLYTRNWLELLRHAETSMEIKGGWDIERSSTCIWASEAAWELGLKSSSLEWAARATREAGHFYEAWHWRAHINHLLGRWQETFDFSSKILTLQRQNHHLVKPEIWTWWGYDLVALSAHNLGRNVEAIEYGEFALAARPDDARLQSNLHFYREALSNQSTS